MKNQEVATIQEKFWSAFTTEWDKLQQLSDFRTL